MPERPILKLKLPKSKAAKPAASADPAATPGAGKKLKIKFGSKPATPATATATTASAKTDGDASKPSPKIVFKKKGRKKREHDDDGAAGGGAANGAASRGAGVKRIKLTAKGSNQAKTPTTPFIKLKAKGKPPVKPMGIGYDSEASDAEEDPHIEEEFILRMPPGDDCEYVRGAIANKNWGPVTQGGADVKLRFLRSDGRRALLVVRGKMYAASMVDLPCVVEGMKSWDKKAWWKTADVCQMLLVLGTVKTEDEALTYPLPDGDVKKGTFMYEHGLTPPMKWVRKRRFRKRVSTNIVMQVEQEVEDLFRRDAEAVNSDYKLQSWDEIEEEQRQQQMDDYFEDAEGEFDDQVQYEGEMMQEDEDEEDEDGGDWEALMEEAEEEQESQAATPAAIPVEVQPTDMGSEEPMSGVNAVVDATDEAETPATQEEAEDSGSDADEDDVDEDADEEELEIRRKKDEIEDLKNAIAEKVAGLSKITNSILKNRQAAQIKSLQEDLERQKAAIGEDEDEEE